MKKTKKVISYLLLLVPLALPAACSPVSTAAKPGSRENREADDEAEQLRIVVERYFQQQADEQSQTAAAAPAKAAAQAAQPLPVQAAALPEQAAEDDAERLRIAVEEYLDEMEAVPVESEAELKEELAGLEKTGEWSADTSQIQCGIGPAAAAEQPAVADTAEPEDEIKPENTKKTACDFPLVRNRQVQFYLDLFQGKQRKNFHRWLERSSRYLPAISKELKAAGLPEELVYLAMIESGFNPSAYSPSHASGLWQFIPGTARHYGLRVDSWTDERRDPEKATKAAAAYLKALHKHFGDWQLAVAAYNAGEGTVEQGLKKYKASNFWELAKHNYLRLETKRYVPQLMAAIIIAQKPEQYGFSNLRQERPLRYDVVKVPAGVSLKAVAAVSPSISVGELRALNNELLKDQIPASVKGDYLLKVPVGSSGLIAANLPKVRSVAAADDYKTHKVAKNETLKEISRKYSVSMTDLLKVNDLRSANLKSGQRLRIPVGGGQDALAKQEQGSGKKAVTASASVSPSREAVVRHTMAKGETLAEVAKKYKVSATSLMKWNKIADARRIKAGRQLTVHLQAEAGGLKIASATATESSGVVELAAQGKKMRPGSSFIAQASSTQKTVPTAVAFLSDSGKQKRAAAKAAEVSYYHVRSGDSLWSIARKLQVTAKELKSWNSLISNLLRPGTKLIIKNG
jgi:membrane-bound lytic murein transglycosylase D